MSISSCQQEQFAKWALGLFLFNSRRAAQRDPPLHPLTRKCDWRPLEFLLLTYQIYLLRDLCALRNTRNFAINCMAALLRASVLGHEYFPASKGSISQMFGLRLLTSFSRRVGFHRKSSQFLISVGRHTNDVAQHTLLIASTVVRLPGAMSLLIFEQTKSMPSGKSLRIRSSGNLEEFRALASFRSRSNPAYR